MRASDNKVVSLNADVTAKAHTKMKTLVAGCETVALKHLPTLLANMLDSADDTLFGLADKAENNSIQSEYFDAMRELRLKRQQLELAYHRSLRESFEQFLKQPSSQDEGEENIESDADDLVLVNENELEEAVAVTTMISKAETRCVIELHAIEYRFNALIYGREIDAETIPLSPTAICRSFKHAMLTFSAEIKIKLIVYKLFDNEVIANLSPLYEECNALLAGAGVLPKLRMTVKKQPHSNLPEKPRLSNENSSLMGTAFMQQEQGQQANTVTNKKVLETLQQLIGSQANTETNQKTSSQVESAPQDDALIHTIDLINALSTIQNREIKYDSTTAIDDIKGLLAEEIDTLKEGGKVGLVGGVNNDIIDIVGMLFEFVLDDEELPVAAKALLSRLQIPMLKIAISDKEFFRKQQHPARRLLNLLAKSALGLDENLRPDHCPLLQKINYIVCRVLDDFQDDVAIFDTLLEEYERFLTLLSGQEEREKASSQTRYDKRKKQKLTDTWVIDAIAVRLKDKEVPKSVYKLITDPWKEVMTQTYLNEGDSSQKWKENLRFIDMLIWSVEPKKIGVDKKKLATIIQQLLSTLKEGLESIDKTDEQIENLMASLEACHMISIKGKTAVKNDRVKVKLESELNEVPIEASDEAVEISQALDAMKNQLDQICEMEDLLNEPLGGVVAKAKVEDIHQEIEEIVLADLDSNKNPIPIVKDEYWDVARNLKIGQWLRLNDDNGRKQRAKMVWHSELLDECTFLNWKFKVVADLTFNELAEKFRSGSAAIIDDLPLFEKAVDTIMNRLHKNAISEA